MRTRIAPGRKSGIATASTLFSAVLSARAEEGLRPIRGPIVPGFWEQNAVWAIPAIILGAALLLVLAEWLRRRLMRGAPLTPRECYDREVTAMTHLLAEGHREEIPARLSRVLREYIEAATGVRAPEQTTEEFLAQAGDDPESGISPEALSDLSFFLSRIDEAKYARRLLSPAELQSLFEAANRFVEANEKTEVSR